MYLILVFKASPLPPDTKLMKKDSLKDKVGKTKTLWPGYAMRFHFIIAP